MNIVERIEKEVALYEATKAELVIELKESFFEFSFKRLFEEHKEVESISWTQYTPSFNDGDPSYFSVNGIDEVNGENSDDYWDDDWDDDDEKEDLPEVDNEIIEKFDEALFMYPNDYLESAYGDGVRITLFSDGTLDINEYDHD